MSVPQDSLSWTKVALRSSSLFLVLRLLLVGNCLAFGLFLSLRVLHAPRLVVHRILRVELIRPIVDGMLLDGRRLSVSGGFLRGFLRGFGRHDANGGSPDLLNV